MPYTAKEYYLDEKTGDIEFTRVKQIVRGDPTFIRLVADSRGVRGDGIKFTCIVPIPHSHQRTHQLRNMQSAIARRSLCQHRMNGKTQYYLEGEHISKFNLAKLYGRSLGNHGRQYDIDGNG